MAGLDAAATPGVLSDRVHASRPRLGRTRLVCIDGPAGSGKTTTAARLAEHLRAQGCAVEAVHLDDLYAGWSGLEGSLWPRLTAQVLEPVRRGRAGRFQRFDWPTGAFAEWVDVPVPAVLVLEGCGAARRACDPVVSLRVWVEAPRDLRLRRGLDRDGEGARPQWLTWMEDEARHFAAERTAQRADVRLDALGRITGTSS
ncbi:uridine kinase family protein [Cellulomonas soli]|uniref:Adenylate kinase n=1 Tax=Cellulomonas soli TaxID=931535 RepID=A0A512PC28_9CELL|nr:ATP/GTP-binding protein [Cellulomonas soli]NYI60912.1 uridine kinase [Cellulomonas soli]GEP68672.1 adenylate kinase [Cellulomonas soli]